MGRFKIFLKLNEAGTHLKDVNKKRGEKPAVVFMGRFQPITKAHVGIIKEMQKKYPGAEPFVFTVRGEKSSQDKEKNPFSFKIQQEMIEKSANIKYVEEVPSAFIGEFIDRTRNKNFEIEAIFCGSDRVKGYQSQVDRYKEELDIDIKVEEIKRDMSSKENISATRVRESLKNNDFGTFQDLTVNLNKRDFIRLQSEIKSV